MACAILDPEISDKSEMDQWAESSVLQLELTEIDSVQQWLFDIRTNTNGESMCILQGKSIHKSPVNLETTANTIKENVLQLRTNSNSLCRKLDDLHVQLSECRLQIAGTYLSSIVSDINSLVKECQGYFIDVPDIFSVRQNLLQESEKLSYLFAELEDLDDDRHSLNHLIHLLIDQLAVLGKKCTTFVEIVQSRLLQALIYSVKESTSVLNIMTAVQTVYTLILEYPSIKSILLKKQILSALFQVCLQTNVSVSSVQLMALQTIAQFCKDMEGRIQFDKIGGIGYLSQVLSSPTSHEKLRVEAAALISQLTSPEKLSHYNQTRFFEHLEVLLKELTDLMALSQQPLSFLIVLSAMANITFMGISVYECLALYKSVKVLIKCWKEGKVDCLDSKDQVATILANLAENQTCREDINSAGGISLLLTLLQTQCVDSNENNEVCMGMDMHYRAKICEQIQQKTAIALARLAKDKHCAQEIENCSGILIFVNICKKSVLRNNSGPVLIACLAALRRLHQALGPSCFAPEDIGTLIRPKMIDSIFACSSVTEESFV